MLKQNIVDLINKFDIETRGYIEEDKLDSEMRYVFAIEKAIQGVSDANLKPIYDKLLSMIGIIRFKYGFESIIIQSDPELENLKKRIDGISLSDDDIINQYNYVSTAYENYISKIKNIDFISNNYENVWGKEGLYLAVESLKSLINNESYRQLLDPNRINELLIDCVKLNNDAVRVEKLEEKYKDIIKQIWEQSISEKVDENGEFRMLFSNISGGSLTKQAEMLINRPFQASCSMISSNFIATYGDQMIKIGFIYPSDSDIVLASAYDLCSNVFGEDSVNKEKGTTIVTPQILEKIGKERAIKNGEDIYSSRCYNEVLVNAKPCGIVVLGLGEKDLNIEYQEAKKLSLEMNLPMICIDIMQYKTYLSEPDKNYIAFHSLMTYLELSKEDLRQQTKNTIGYTELNDLTNTYKEQLVDAFLTLKEAGNLNKDNMVKEMSDVIGVPKINSGSKHQK